MKRYLSSNPLDVLDEESAQKLKLLEDCADLDFLRAVGILGLDPQKDFRHSDLSGLDLSDLDLSKFDISGADIEDCKLPSSLPIENEVEILGRNSLHDDQQRAQLGAIQLSHKEDGVVLGYNNGAVELWSSDGRKCIWDAWYGDLEVSQVEFTGYYGGQILVIYSTGSAIELSTSEGKLISSYDFPNKSILSATKIGDRHGFVVTDSEGSSSILEANGNEIRRFNGHSKSVLGATTSQDGQFIATSAADDTICIWSATSGSELMRIGLSYDKVFNLEFNPIKDEIISISREGLLQVWNLNNGKETARFTTDLGPVATARYLPDGRIAVAFSFGSICIWSGESKEWNQEFPLDFFITCLAVRKKLLCVGGGGGNFACIDVSTL